MFDGDMVKEVTLALGSIRAEPARELWLFAALKLLVTVQVVLAVVGAATLGTDVRSLRMPCK